ncbi:hypothetical protein [Soonwooa sp.]|uniref:hypothetical protein n=1 Tax=Soonwooa sp. TaxID=1938592 RepID=UPI0028AA6C9E|nr:hypothetical protein [Soonwooa sp.]
MAIDPNYTAAKHFLNLLPDALAVKLCKQKLAGVENKKKSKQQRVRDFKEYLKRK